MAATWLADVLRQAGLPVREMNGWKTRNAGYDVHPQAVVVHATVTRRNSGPASGLSVVAHGRAGLPGPIAQLHLSRDGVFTTVAAGGANHAGRGGFRGLSGNGSVLGIEAENDNGLERPAEPWSAVQYSAYVRGVAALLRKLGKDESWVCGHKEWSSTGKSDPTFGMAKFRADVGAVLRGRPAGVAFDFVAALRKRTGKPFPLQRAKDTTTGFTANALVVPAAEIVKEYGLPSDRGPALQTGQKNHGVSYLEALLNTRMDGHDGFFSEDLQKLVKNLQGRAGDPVTGYVTAADLARWGQPTAFK